MISRLTPTGRQRVYLPTTSTTVMGLLAVLCGPTVTFAQALQYEELGESPAGLAPCDLPQVPGEAWCGSLSVPEDRDDTEGRHIDLNIVVLRALESEVAPAAFYVSGGPGTGAAMLAAALGLNYPVLRRGLDLVLVDRRGTGGSNPLQCTFDDFNESLRAFLIIQIEEDDVLRCRSGLSADLAHYSTWEEVEDLDAVRAALGLDNVNLLGASYGTRVALAYAVRYPGHTRSMALYGVAPPSLRVPSDVAADVDRALNALIVSCAEDTSCGAAYPNLGTELDSVVARLAAEPITVESRHPTSGAALSVVITRDVFMGAMRTFLNGAVMAQQLPFMIHRAYEGDHGPVAALLVPTGVALSRILHLGTYLSVVCAEDLALLDPETVRARARGSRTGTSLFDNHLAACRSWGMTPAARDFPRDWRSIAPTILVSGKYDPVTPARWIEAALDHLPNAVHLRNPDAGHADSIGPCESDAIITLFETGTLPVEAIGCTKTEGLQFRVP
jgi:pimeloyl-ACP methyl ester carboxylesterase